MRSGVRSSPMSGGASRSSPSRFSRPLQSIPKDIYEAAAIDGAGALQRFRSITLPFLAPTIAITVLLRTVWIANFADLIVVMTKGGPADSTQDPLELHLHDRVPTIGFRLCVGGRGRVARAAPRLCDGARRAAAGPDGEELDATPEARTLPLLALPLRAPGLFRGLRAVPAVLAAQGVRDPERPSSTARAFGCGRRA